MCNVYQTYIYMNTCSTIRLLVSNHMAHTHTRIHIQIVFMAAQ